MEDQPANLWLEVQSDRHISARAPRQRAAHSGMRPHRPHSLAASWPALAAEGLNVQKLDAEKGRLPLI